MDPEHEHMLQPDELEALTSLSLDEVRARRDACVEAETGLSYLRRMVQGPLDIVRSELERRSGGSGPSDLAALVASLPETLGEQGRPAGVGRLVQALEPKTLDPDLVEELGGIASAHRMARVPEMRDDELTDFAEELRGFEARVSELRHRFFEVIDALQAEITRRYREGEASVESLLET
jgi:hypothetical protein